MTDDMRESRILNETTEIQGIYWDNENLYYRKKDGWAIVSYMEPAPGGALLYYEVSKNGKLHSRLPAYNVEVVYD